MEWHSQPSMIEDQDKAARFRLDWRGYILFASCLVAVSFGQYFFSNRPQHPSTCLPNCSHANLSGASLQGINLDETILDVANLSEADLRGASLRGANLNEAFLRDIRLHSAKYDSLTVWPTGFDPIEQGAVKED